MHISLRQEDSRSSENGDEFLGALRFNLAQTRRFSLGRYPSRSSEQILTQSSKKKVYFCF